LGWYVFPFTLFLIFPPSLSSLIHLYTYTHTPSFVHVHHDKISADIRYVGAMLHTPLVEGEPPQARGSAMLIGASTREEVVERLKKDVYVKDGVWDFEKVQIIPFRSAIRKPL
jgi:hypothetical protein